jgi:hypothetical protein
MVIRDASTTINPGVCRQNLQEIFTVGEKRGVSASPMVSNDRVEPC